MRSPVSAATRRSFFRVRVHTRIVWYSGVFSMSPLYDIGDMSVKRAEFLPPTGDSAFNPIAKARVPQPGTLARDSFKTLTIGGRHPPLVTLWSPPVERSAA